MTSNFAGIQAHYATLGMFLVPEIVICLKFKTISLKCPKEPRKITILLSIVLAVL